MKKISTLLPTFNEEENVVPLSEEIVSIFLKKLPEYDYEIVFIDNYSTDNTRLLLRQLCKENKKIKAIFNARNFVAKSLIYGLTQTIGDCTIMMDADFQDPPNLIPQFVAEWEKGYKIVIGTDSTSKEKRLMRFLREMFYHLFRKMSEVEQISHYHGVGLYDRSFLDIIRNLKDSDPDFRGIVAQLGFKRTEIHYKREERRKGKSKLSLYSLYDFAMRSFVSYTKVFLRIPIFLGFIIGLVSFMVAVYYFVLKIIDPGTLQWGIASAIIGVFFLGGIQLVFLGLLGEYVMAINTRVMARPWVIEEERINFEEENGQKSNI